MRWALLVAATVTAAVTLTLRADQAYTGRIVQSGHTYYFVVDRRFYRITNADRRPDVASNVFQLVTLTGSLSGYSVVATKVEPRLPEVLLKRLFPTAAAYSPRGGDPLHYDAYAVDPVGRAKAVPIGFAFWTTDLVPEERGYDGPIAILVGMNTAGMLTGVIVDYNTEPYGPFSIDVPRFSDQFVAKSIRDPFRVGGDVDAVSGASISVISASRAIRNSARAVARKMLSPGAVP